MAGRNIRVRGIRRKEIDEDKLALAFLLLAKSLHEQDVASDGPVSTPDRRAVDAGPEAA